MAAYVQCEISSAKHIKIKNTINNQNKYQEIIKRCEGHIIFY